MMSKKHIVSNENCIVHNYHEITNILLSFSDSTILTNNYIHVNPQHKSICELITDDQIIVYDSILLKKSKKETKISINNYMYYLSYICKWNKIDHIIQIHKFFNSDLKSFCYAFTTVYFESDYKKCESEFTNIITALEIFGNELFEDKSYYYNWYNDNFVKGEDMFKIGLLVKQNVIWN